MDPDRGFSGLTEGKKSHSSAFVRGGGGTLQLHFVGGKKKSEQTSSKIDCTDRVFYSEDSIFTWYMT